MDRLSHTPLYIQLKEDILKKIEADMWSIGSQIASEKELMEQNDVGRETVRKAISILVQEGYLIKKRGIGTFVHKKKPSIGFEPIISLSHILQVRGLKGTNRVIENRIRPLDETLKEETKMTVGQCRYIYRIRYVDGKPLAREYAYLKEDGLMDYDFSQSISAFVLENKGKSIKRIEQVITTSEANEEDMYQLGLEAGTKLLILDRWIYIEDEDDVYFYIKFIIPADIYSLAL